MKTLLWICFSLLFTDSSFARTSVHAEEATPPSCDVVRLRLREVGIRMTEASQLLNWYEPEELTPKQLQALANLLHRMPHFENDRHHERLRVTHEWKVTGVNQPTSVSLRSGKHQWSDPFHGNFPEGVKVTITPEQVTLEQSMSYEEFCVLDPQVNLRLGSVELQSINDLQQL